MGVIRSILLLLSVILASILPTSYAVEPLERVNIDSPRLVNAFGVTINQNVNLNQQLQITADIGNNQDISQDFVYIVQIKTSDNVIVYLAWITGNLNPNQSFSPALSWTPRTTGVFTAEIYVWESLTNQDALSEPASVKISTS